ncbi:MAG: copper chaperone PCu(A)C [Betaproteobacteria bacterium]
MKRLMVAMVFVSALPGWLCSLPAIGADNAVVEVSNAWVRSTVPGQPVAGAYMDLRAARTARLVGVSSPISSRGEIHEMKEEDGMMKMRAVNAVELPAGKTVSLGPGGLHVMLFGIKAPLAEGTMVALTLRFERASGTSFSRVIRVPVKSAEDAPGHGHDK